MAVRQRFGIDGETFRRLSLLYRRRWKFSLCATSPDGSVVPGFGRDVAGAGRDIRRLAIESALRWGEPTLTYGAAGQLAWAVPLMRNSEVLGGLVATTCKALGGPGDALPDLRAACTDLRLLAEAENLTNAAILESRRNEYLHEQARANAIHEFKVSPHSDVRRMYLQNEPELLAAIRRGDSASARQILNSTLVAILHCAGESLNLIKAFFMELVVTMCRTAVEAGGKPEELLGANFRSLLELSEIQSQEQLAPWLHQNLEHVMGAIGSLKGRPAIVPLTAALDFMEANLARDISREDIAHAAHLSPYHFSRLFKVHTGRSCGDMLNQMRVDKAAELLTRTDQPLAAIAIDCGFHDQSYFTKVFRRYFKATPMQYRNGRSAGDADAVAAEPIRVAAEAQAARDAAPSPRRTHGPTPRTSVDLQLLADCLIQGDLDRVKQLTRQALTQGASPKDVLERGLVAGMNEIGRRFKANEVYVPEVLIAARSMKGGMEILQPALTQACVEPVGTVVLGTVKGDIHDIGKNLVGMMLTGAGLRVIDIGTDAPAAKFVDACKDHNADVCAVSVLLTTTMPQAAEVVAAIKAAHLKTRTLIGGAPVTQKFVDDVGADGYAPDAATAADVALTLL